jgi:hypothetical protein
MFMPKRPISVTLDVDNLLWLKGQTASGKRRSLSDTIDAVLTAARTGAHGGTTSRSVVGTVDIAAEDPALDRADAYVRRELEASLARGLIVHESRSSLSTGRPSRPASYTTPRRSAKPQKGARGRKARG